MNRVDWVSIKKSRLLQMSLLTVLDLMHIDKQSLE